MAYTPPVGNAVAFVFSVSGYSPPAGSAVPFVFGSGGGGGGTPLPFRAFVKLLYRQRFTRKWHKGWRPRPLRNRFSVAPASPVVVIVPKPPSRMLYRQRFTKKWHKGWRPRHLNVRLAWMPNSTSGRVTWSGVEVVTTGTSANNVRATWSGLEVITPGPANHPAFLSWMGLEVVCSIQSFDDGILTIIL